MRNSSCYCANQTKNSGIQTSCKPTTLIGVDSELFPNIIIKFSHVDKTLDYKILLIPADDIRYKISYVENGKLITNIGVIKSIGRNFASEPTTNSCMFNNMETSKVKYLIELDHSSTLSCAVSKIPVENIRHAMYYKDNINEEVLEQCNGQGLVTIGGECLNLKLTNVTYRTNPDSSIDIIGGYISEGYIKDPEYKSGITTGTNISGMILNGDYSGGYITGGEIITGNYTSGTIVGGTTVGDITTMATIENSVIDYILIKNGVGDNIIVEGGLIIDGSLTNSTVENGTTTGGTTIGGITIGDTTTGGTTIGGTTLGDAHGIINGSGLTGTIIGGITSGGITNGTTIGGTITGGQTMGNTTIGGTVTGGITSGTTVGGITFDGTLIPNIDLSPYNPSTGDPVIDTPALKPNELTGLIITHSKFGITTNLGTVNL